MVNRNPYNAVIMLIALILTATVLGSFLLWYQELGHNNLSLPFRVFVWALVASDVFLLLTRAWIEGRRGRR